MENPKMHLGGQMEKGKEVGKNGITIENKLVPKASC